METAAPPQSERFPAFVTGAVCGYLVWFLSVPLTGRREPWDAGGLGALYYPGTLFLAGFAGYLLTRWKKPLLWGLYAGQCGYLFTSSGGPGNLFPLGLIALAIYLLPALAGVWLAGRVVRARDEVSPSKPPARSGRRDYLDD